MMSTQSLFLVGLKHVGKSTLASIAARTLNMTVLDLDTIIVELSEGCTGPREVYRRYGKDEFMRREALATDRAVAIATEEDVIIASGGGIADNPGALDSLRSSGLPVLYLFEQPLVLYDRVRAGGVPAFLDPERPREHFLELAESRDRAYRSIATAIVDVRERSISEAGAQLIEDIRRINVR